MSRNKYHARKTKAHGFTFDSMGEAARYGELLFLQRAKRVSHLRRQIPYPIDIAGVNVGKLIIDFVYIETRSGHAYEILEDFKGIMTPLARFKIKCVEAQYKTSIRISR